MRIIDKLELDNVVAERYAYWMDKANKLESENKRLREALEKIINDEDSCGDDCANRMQDIAEEALKASE